MFGILFFTLNTLHNPGFPNTFLNGNKPAYNFRAASYGKSSTNGVENPKISLKPQTILYSLVTEQQITAKRTANSTLPLASSPRNSINHLKSESIATTAQYLEPDTIPTKVVYIEQSSPKELIVHFSQDLDSTFAIIPEFYSIEHRTPREITWGDYPNSVKISLWEPLQNKSQYTLKTSKILDIFGNVVSSSKAFITSKNEAEIPFKTIVINEIMAAPKKENPLPYVEYIELFNTSEETIELGGFFLSNSSRKAIIPDVSISPNEYLILVHEDDQEAFSSYGATAGLSSWPRFVNGGDQVILKDRSGTPVDSLAYTSDSYGSSSKASAGFSLEVVNPFSKCDQSLLLKSSESAQMGTPGRENSVFDPTPDQMGPKLLQAIVLDRQSLLLEFDEALSPDLSHVIWEFTSGLMVTDASFSPESLTSIRLTLSPALEEKTQYKITVENLRDCAGNLIDPNHSQATFQVPSEAEEGEIILNEVLFNPRSGTPKFVELYNHSTKYIDLSGWKLANISKDEVDNKKIFTENATVIAPFDYRVITTDIEQLAQEYPKGRTEKWMEISSLPSYPIAEGSVIVLSPDESLIERFDYSDKYHHAILQNTKGISLERLSPKQSTNEPQNWHSAAAAEGYATPGYKNSQHFDLDEAGTGIQINPKVFVPDATGEQPFTTISYKMKDVGFIGTVKIFGTDGRLIKIICQNDVWGTAGFYTWDGMDKNGTKVRPGYYVVLSEIVHLDGTVIQHKNTVVVGSKL